MEKGLAWLVNMIASAEITGLQLQEGSSAGGIPRWWIIRRLGTPGWDALCDEGQYLSAASYVARADVSFRHTQRRRPFGDSARKGKSSCVAGETTRR